MPNASNEESIVSSTDDAGTSGNSYAKSIKLDPDLIPHQKLTQCINNLNIKAKTIKLLEQNIQVIFMTLDLALEF